MATKRQKTALIKKQVDFLEQFDAATTPEQELSVVSDAVSEGLNLNDIYWSAPEQDTCLLSEMAVLHGIRPSTLSFMMSHGLDLRSDLHNQLDISQGQMLARELRFPLAYDKDVYVNSDKERLTTLLLESDYDRKPIFETLKFMLAHDKSLIYETDSTNQRLLPYYLQASGNSIINGRLFNGFIFQSVVHMILHRETDGPYEGIGFIPDVLGKQMSAVRLINGKPTRFDLKTGKQYFIGDLVLIFESEIPLILGSIHFPVIDPGYCSDYLPSSKDLSTHCREIIGSRLLDIVVDKMHLAQSEENMMEGAVKLIFEFNNAKALHFYRRLTLNSGDKEACYFHIEHIDLKAH